MRTSRLLVAVALTSAVACSGNDANPTAASDSSEQSSTSTPTEPVGGTTSGAAASPTLPEPISGAARTTTLPDHLVAARPLPGDPDWLVDASDAIWVKRDDGNISRIDPVSARQTDDIASGYDQLPVCQGLVSDGTRLWSCAGENRLATIDPRTRTADPLMKVPRLGDQTRFVVNHDRLWVIGADGTSLSGVDLRTRRVDSSFDLGAFCTDLARADQADSGLVYAVCPSDGLVLAVDTEQEKVTARVALPDARLAAVGRDLWVGFEGGLAQLDPESLEVTAVYAVTPGLEGSIWAGGDDMWVRTTGRVMLTHIDGKTHEVLEEIRGDRRFSHVGDLVVRGGTLWTTASDDGYLLKLRI